VTFEAGSRLREIGQFALFHCLLVMSIVIPASVEVIGAACFKACSDLSDVTFELGSKLLDIEGSAFQMCPSLKVIRVPSRLVGLCQRCLPGRMSLIIALAEERTEAEEVGTM
jgi:hypothetical protein